MCGVYYGVSLHYIHIPFTMVRAFFLEYSSRQLRQGGHTHGTISDIRASPISITLCISVTFQTTGWSDNWMTGHVTLFFSIQFDPSSIEMLTDVYVSLYMIQCSYSHFFISALALSPTLGLCDWGRVNLKERQR